MRRFGALIATVSMAALIISLTPDHLLRDTSVQPLAARHSGPEDAETVAAEDLVASENRELLVGRIFDFSSLNRSQTRWAQEVLAGGCTYEWGGLATGLAGRRIKVRIGAPSARAMFYPAELRIVLHRYYFWNDRTQARRLLAWEAAHAVDLLAMTDEQRHEITDLYHPDGSDSHEWLAGTYESHVGEAFMEGFVAAFCPSLAAESTFEHLTTPQIADQIHSLLG